MPREYYREDQVIPVAAMDYVSASQISTAKACVTKWFLSRRTPRSSTDATDLGTEVHSCNEEYLLAKDASGDWSVNAARVATAMRKHLPLPGHPPELVEALIEWHPEGWLVPIKGFIDVVEPVGTRRLDGFVVEHNTITDEKTTSSWSYMKSSEDLALDPQAIFYAAWALLSPDSPFHGNDYVRFRHVTAITKGAKAGKESRTVMYEFTKAELQQRLDELHEEYVVPLKELSVLSWPEDIDSIPYNNSACWQYGRCEFWDICQSHGRTPERKTKVPAAADEFSTAAAELLAELLE